MIIRLNLFKYNYRIDVRRNYLGASLSNKIPLPSEDWIRGRDLPDGKLNPKTLWRIISSILSWELKKR